MAVRLFEFETTLTDKAGPGLQALGDRIDALRTKIQAARGNYDALTQATTGLVAPTGALTGKSQELTQTLQGLARSGIAPFTQGIPGAGTAIGGLVSKLGGLPLAITAVIGAGVALISYLKDLQNEAGKTLTTVVNLSAGIAAKFQATNAEILQIEQAGAGNRVAAAEAGFAKIATLAEQEKTSRIRTAETTRDAELNSIISTEASRNQALGTFRAERADAEATEANTLRAARAKLAADTIQIEREQATFTRDLATTAAQAAQERAAAEAQASGSVLAVLEAERATRITQIESEKAARLESIRATLGTSQAAATARRDAEQVALDQIVKAEIQTAEKRRGIIEGFVSTAITALTRLGGSMSELAEKLTLEQKLSAARKEFEAFQGLMEAGKVTTQQAADATRKLADELKQSAKTGEQLTSVYRELTTIVPRGLQEAVKSAVALETSTHRVGDAFFQSKAQAEEYERSLKKVAAAAKEVENVQTTHSLLDSTLAVEAGIHRGTTAVQSYGQALTDAANRAKVLDEQLGITSKGGMGALERSLSEQADRLADIREQLGLPTGAAGGGGGGGDGGPRRQFLPDAPIAGGPGPFAFAPAGDGPQPLAVPGRPTAPTMLNLPDLAKVLEAIAHPERFPAPGYLGQQARLGEAYIPVGQGPFGPIFQEARARLEQLKVEIRAQADAQRRVREFTENILGGGAPAAGIGRDFQGGPPRTTNINVNFGGTTFLDGAARADALAEEIARLAADQARREG